MRNRFLPYRVIVIILAGAAAHGSTAVEVVDPRNRPRLPIVPGMSESHRLRSQTQFTF